MTHDIDPKFWALLGGEPSDEQPIKTAAEVTDDSEEGGDVGEGVLYRLSDAHGDELIVSEVTRGVGGRVAAGRGVLDASRGFGRVACQCQGVRRRAWLKVRARRRP